MPDFQYGSYCGIYCGACDIMHQFKKGQEAGITPSWENLPLILQNHLPVPKDSPIVCYGCKSDVVFNGCRKCPMRKCARKRAHINNCTECTKFPCLRFKIWKLVIHLRGLHKKMPHLLVINSNLRAIQENGFPSWLKSQKKEWNCPECNSPLTWYSKDNHRCQEIQQLNSSVQSRLEK